MTDDHLTNADVIARWAAHAEDSVADFREDGDFARQHLLNPTLFALLGDVRGRTVLDAGCGNGYLSRLLTRRGAVVTGVEPALYRLAVAWEQADPLGGTYLQADLSRLLSDVPRLSGAFDVVVCNMVLQDIPDCDAALATCVRCLRPGGDFVFSILHPCFEESAAAWAAQGYVSVAEYFAPRAVPQSRIGYFFHRPLSYYLNAVVENGGRIRRVVEPQLPDGVTGPSRAYERDRHVPSFLVVHATAEATVSGSASP